MSIEHALRTAYEGKTVLVTGHTGFKGSWLCEWLLKLGAHIVGVALPPETEPSLFEQLRLMDRLEHHLQDIRDRDAFIDLVTNSQPDYVFHLAAQPLVRESYAKPVETYAANVMGTVHLLEALRKLQVQYRQTTSRYCAAVFITTDKCYENREWVYGYREHDRLGGYDPYSSSKACAELAIESFRKCFFNPEHAGEGLKIVVASARSGNVIGGGDWASDRLVPDCVRHLQRKLPIPVRNPKATRPWQHVLEPIFGYLLLAMRGQLELTAHNLDALSVYSSAFNFGSSSSSNKTVEDLVCNILQTWPGTWENLDKNDAPHEATFLSLVSDKAFHLLGWEPIWGFEETVARTILWYRRHCEADYDPEEMVKADIAAYGQQALSGLSKRICRCNQSIGKMNTKWR